jgi:hypothetical protein
MQIVEAIYERDIDLLLIEEFVSNGDFISYFLKNTSVPKPLDGAAISAYRSVVDTETGETDILLEFESDQGLINVFIENKIDANFQPQQIERYQKRKEKSNNESYIALVAPKEYIKGSEAFDFVVEYEYIKEFFDQNDRRGKYKHHILAIAIDKLRRGYSAVNHPQTLDFYQFYYEKTLKFSNVQMDEPLVKPKGSTWVRLWSQNHERINAYHKIKQNKIDIEIPNFLRDKYSATIFKYKQNGMLIENKNSCYLSHKFPLTVDLYQNPSIYESSILDAIKLVAGVFEEM